MVVFAPSIPFGTATTLLADIFSAQISSIRTSMAHKPIHTHYIDSAKADSNDTARSFQMQRLWAKTTKPMNQQNGQFKMLRAMYTHCDKAIANCCQTQTQLVVWWWLLTLLVEDVSMLLVVDLMCNVVDDVILRGCAQHSRMFSAMGSIMFKYKALGKISYPTTIDSMCLLFRPKLVVSVILYLKHHSLRILTISMLWKHIK